MLVLSRMVGQEIVVPDCSLIFSILEVRGNRIRLGITAPAEVRVYRREVWEHAQANAALPEDGSSTKEKAGR